MPLPAPPPVRQPGTPARPSPRAGVPVGAAIELVWAQNRVGWGVSVRHGALTFAAVMPAGSTSADAAVAALSALVTRPELEGRPLVLVVSDEALWAAMAAAAARHPRLSMSPRHDAATGTYVGRSARAVVREALEADGLLAPVDPTEGTAQPAEEVKDLPQAPIEIGTDGSWGRGRDHGGWGWVSSTGQHGVGVILADCVLATELAAVNSALRAHRQQPVSIRLDSRAALRLIRHAQMTGSHASTAQRDVNRELDVLVRELRRRTKPASFSWVRGHAGDPLNEGADRLAVQARRAHEAKSKQHLHDVCASIVAETVATIAA